MTVASFALIWLACHLPVGIVLWKASRRKFRS